MGFTSNMMDFSALSIKSINFDLVKLADQIFNLCLSKINGILQSMFGFSIPLGKQETAKDKDWDDWKDSDVIDYAAYENPNFGKSDEELNRIKQEQANLLTQTDRRRSLFEKKVPKERRHLY